MVILIIAALVLLAELGLFKALPGFNGATFAALTTIVTTRATITPEVPMMNANAPPALVSLRQKSSEAQKWPSPGSTSYLGRTIKRFELFKHRMRFEI